MNRIEKKCFVGSVMLHGLLLAVVLFGAAFLSSPKFVKIGPVIDMKAIPTDLDKNTGGNPNGNPTPPPLALAKPEPPPPVKQEVKPEPVKPEPVRKEERQPVKEKPEFEERGAKPGADKVSAHHDRDSPHQQRGAGAPPSAAVKRKRPASISRRWSAGAEQKRSAQQIGGIIGGVGESWSRTDGATDWSGRVAYANYSSLIWIITDARSRRVILSDEDAGSFHTHRGFARRDGEQFAVAPDGTPSDKQDRAMNSSASYRDFPRRQWT
jgi:hypothetical protein